MIYLSNEQIKDLSGFCKVSKDKVQVRTSKGFMTIPSKYYPLHQPKTIKFFYCLNTEEIPEDDEYYSILKEVFNNTPMVIGMCFSNVNVLKNNLSKTIIPNDYIKTYSGWVYIPNARLSTHTFLVYKDKYIIDYSLSKKEPLSDLPEEIKVQLSQEEVRELLLKQMQKEDKMLNSDSKTFGKVSFPYIMIASECDEETMFKLVEDTLNKIPKHPFYSNLKHINPLQEKNFKEKNLL